MNALEAKHLWGSNLFGIVTRIMRNTSASRHWQLHSMLYLDHTILIIILLLSCVHIGLNLFSLKLSEILVQEVLYLLYQFQHPCVMSDSSQKQSLTESRYMNFGSSVLEISLLIQLSIENENCSLSHCVRISSNFFDNLVMYVSGKLKAGGYSSQFLIVGKKNSSCMHLYIDTECTCL